MPIQFSCSQCQKKMQAPDGTEGKRARCPACSAITQIPAAAVVAEVPVAQVARPATPPPPVGDNPFAAPSTTDFSESQVLVGRDGSYSPVWQQQPSFSNFFKSTKQILLEPGSTFRNMKRSGGFGAELGYAAIGGGLVGVLIGVFAFLVLVLVLLSGGDVAVGLIGAAIGGSVAALLYALFYAFAAVVGCFIGGGVIHLLMMIVGGKKYGYEATVRTVAYTQWSVWPFLIVPIVGWLASVVWLPIVLIIGLAEVHETTKSRAALAVLLPYLLALGLGGVAAAIEQLGM